MSAYLPSPDNLRFFWAVMIKEVGESCDYDFHTLVSKINSDVDAYKEAMIKMGMVHYWLQLMYEKDPDAYVELVKSMFNETSEKINNFGKDFLDREMFILRSFALADPEQIEDYLTDVFSQWFPLESVDFSALSRQAKHAVDLIEQNFAYRQSLIPRYVSDALPNDRARAIKHLGTLEEYVDFLIQTLGMGQDLKYLDKASVNARKEYLRELLIDQQDQKHPTALQEYELKKLMHFDEMITHHTKSLNIFEIVNNLKDAEYDEDALFITLRINNVGDFLSRKEAEFWLQSAENRQEIPGKILFLQEVIKQLEWFSNQFADERRLLSAKIFEFKQLDFWGPEISELPDNIWDVPSTSESPESTHLVLAEASGSVIIKDILPAKESGYVSISSGESSAASSPGSVSAPVSAAESFAPTKMASYGNLLKSLMPKKGNKIVDENSPLLVEKSAPKQTPRPLGRGLPEQKRQPLRPIQPKVAANLK
jgi:hypothetical protein